MPRHRTIRRAVTQPRRVPGSRATPALAARALRRHRHRLAARHSRARGRACARLPPRPSGACCGIVSPRCCRHGTPRCPATRASLRCTRSRLEENGQYRRAEKIGAPRARPRSRTSRRHSRHRPCDGDAGARPRRSCVPCRDRIGMGRRHRIFRASGVASRAVPSRCGRSATPRSRSTMRRSRMHGASDMSVLADASALLWRLQLRNIEVGGRWQRIGRSVGDAVAGRRAAVLRRARHDGVRRCGTRAPPRRACSKHCRAPTQRGASPSLPERCSARRRSAKRCSPSPAATMRRASNG